MRVQGDLEVTATLAVTGDIANPTYSSVVFTSTTQGETTGVLTEAQLIASDYFEFSLGTTANVDYTFPASSTNWLPDVGDKQQLIFRNVASTTAGMGHLGLISSVGVNIESSSSTPHILASSTASVLCYRDSTTDINCLMDNYTARL